MESPPRARGAPGFSLIELLVITAIVGLLVALLTPALTRARAQSMQAYCGNNLRQLALANHRYAADHGHYVAAAPDIWAQNATRWHGARTTYNEPFDIAASPLAPYFGEAGWIKECPAFRAREPGFESGCGGYGYNVRGVGSQAYLVGGYLGAERGMPAAMIAQPSMTVMFTDAAFLDLSRRGSRLIEYSFAEAPFHVADNQPVETHRAVPSIHFRHEGKANVAWVDGHVSSESRSVSYGPRHDAAAIGWFGPDNNSFFDPF